MPRIPILPSLVGAALLAGLSIPAYAQETNYPPQAHPGFTALSDVSGPFLGNVESPGSTLRTGSPINTIVGVSSLDTSTKEILLAPPQLDLGEVLKLCIHTSDSMDKLSPFSGCSTVNWKMYNRAVRDTKALRRELTKTVVAQEVALKANPSPTQRQMILDKLTLLEKTTTALEATTNTLTALGAAMDKAR